MGRILSEYVKRQLHSTMDRVGSNERRSKFNEHAIKMLAKKLDDVHDAIELLEDKVNKLIERLSAKFGEIDSILADKHPQKDAETQDGESASQS